MTADQIQNNGQIPLGHKQIVGWIDVSDAAQIQIRGVGDSGGTGVVELKKGHGSPKIPQSFTTAKTLSLDGTPESIKCHDFDYLVLEVTTSDANESVEVLFYKVPFSGRLSEVLGYDVSIPVLSGYNASVVTETASAFTIDIDTFDDHGTGFDYSDSGGEITINEAGTYRIAYSVGIYSTWNSDRNGVASLQLDTGGGFSDVAGTLATSYIRGTVTDKQHMSITPVALDLDVGDKIRVRVVPSATIGATAEHCRIDIERMI